MAKKKWENEKDVQNYLKRRENEWTKMLNLFREYPSLNISNNWTWKEMFRIIGNGEKPHQFIKKV